MSGGVSVKDVEKRFGDAVVLRGVSLDIAEGEFLTLLGPSGCGKSTLLRVVAGLETQDAGAVSIRGRSVDALPPKQRDVAMVFQSYALYPHLTVAQNLTVPLRMRRLSRAQRFPVVGRHFPGARSKIDAIERDVHRVARALEIDHLLDRKPGQLSGGQRQRVAVGRAVVREPAVFLMDEPLSNLDAKLRVSMRAEIKELHRRLGVTFIYVTHDQAEAMTLSDRVAVMLDGELLQVAKPISIYNDPEDRRVAEFVGSPKINLLEGRVGERGEVEVAGAVFDGPAGLEPGSKVSVGLRPEAFDLAERSGPGVLAGTVRLVEHMGADAFAHLDVPGMEKLLIARLPGRCGALASDGDLLRLGSNADDALFFDQSGARIRTTRSPAATPAQCVVNA